MSYKIITLKPGKEETLLRFHPWIFSGAIQSLPSQITEGEIVQVNSSKGNFIAVGHYQIGSIAVRVLSFKEEQIDIDFWKIRIQNAYYMRKAINLCNGDINNTFRLIHGEGDTLPGLIIDVYADTAVMQAHSVGMHQDRKIIAQTIVDVVPEVRNVFYKSETTLPFKAPINPEDGYIIGEKSDAIAVENGLKFQADWIRGQKTGFFIDQRENRSLLEAYAKDRTVLNMFCYTGGFSFYAMRGNAKLVHSVDSSGKAIELTNKNIELNFGNDPRHESFTTDAFKFLDNMHPDAYDLVILDPPAFAKHRSALRNALQGYRKLNAKAFDKIKPGGILFTFSCSQVVTKEQFRLAVFSAAAQSKRHVRILHQLTQPADHPINIYHPEGEYLKGLVLYVE